MIKTAATQDQIKVNLKQLIKDNLEAIKAVIADPNISQSVKSQKIDDMIVRLNTIIDAQVSSLNARTTPLIATPTAISAANDGKVPEMWRQNLDYGERK